MFYLKNPFSAAGICFLAVSSLILFALSGCQRPTNSPPASDASEPKTAQNRPANLLTPEANVYVDEAMLAKPYAIIGGAVENIGTQKLEKLSVEIELRRRT